jgi:trimeric autotransporter adhesin
LTSVALGAACVGVPQAQAQFVCGAAGTYPVVSNQVVVSGDSAFAPDPAAVACGSNALAVGLGTTAVGTAAGTNSSSNNERNSFFGQSAGSSVNGSNNSAFGFGAGENVIGNSNSAYGDSAGIRVTGSNNVAIGHNAGSGTSGSPLAVSNTVAIGNGSTARADGAVAIGNGAQATRANQVVLGTAAYTYTMPGITSPSSLAAQTGPVQIVTSDGGGNLATSSLAALGIASAADIGAINTSLGAINTRLDELSGRTDKALTGVAMAFALAGVPTVLPHEIVAFTANWGTFEGQHGFAMNGAVRVTNNVQLNGGAAFGANQNLAGGRVGLRVGW